MLSGTALVRTERVLYPKKKKAFKRLYESLVHKLYNYVHCWAHILNLILIKSCAIPEIESTFDFTGDIDSFF